MCVLLLRTHIAFFKVNCNKFDKMYAPIIEDIHSLFIKVKLLYHIPTPLLFFIIGVGNI